MGWKPKPPPQPDYAGMNAQQQEAVKEQTREQYQMDLLTSLMTAGKIPVMDVTDPDIRASVLREAEEMGYDLSNPFPDYIAGAGDKLIADIVAASESVPDFSARFEQALAESGRLEAIRASGTAVLEQIYQQGEGSLQAAVDDNFEALRAYNAENKLLNLEEAEQIQAKQDAVNAAGRDLASSVEGLNDGTDNLLFDKKLAGDEGTTNVLNASLAGNENVEGAQISSATNTSDTIIKGAEDVANTAGNVAGKIAQTAETGLKGIAGATSTSIDANKNQELSGISSIADTKSDALADTTQVGTTGIEDVANVSSVGNESIRDTAKSGIGDIFDAEINSATGIRDVSLDNAASLEGAQLNEADLMGNQMRRMAMTGRRAAEDAYNQQMRGMRTAGIGQGTGSNMRSAFAQNRANQAQGMFAPMAQADATQLGMESQARLGRAQGEADANLGFAMDKGIAGVGKAKGFAFADDNFAGNQALTNLQEAEGLAGVRLADSVTQGEINTEEAVGTAGVLNNATAASGQNDINTASGLAQINNTQAGTVGGAENKQASTTAGAQAAAASQIGDAGVSKAASDAAANVNAETGFTQNQMDYLNGLIESNQATNQNQVSADEIRLNNELRNMGFSDPQIAALRTNLGYDLGEANQSFSNYNNLMNMRLANLGMTANQAQLMKYMQGAPTDIAMGGMDAIARYSSPYTMRSMAPAHQSYINTAPYIPTASGGGGGGGFLDKFINFSNRYQNL